MLVAGDPSTDLAALGRIEAVWQDGVRFDPEELRAAARGKIR